MMNLNYLEQQVIKILLFDDDNQTGLTIEKVSKSPVSVLDAIKLVPPVTVGLMVLQFLSKLKVLLVGQLEALDTFN